jgi:tRNA (guanine37-N1)-methyltransferase
LKSHLSKQLSHQELINIYNSYDVIGEIAIIKTSEDTRKHGEIIAESIMNTHKNIKTVLAQTGAISGRFRLRQLGFVAGEKKTITKHKESDCLFLVDVAKCYFSPRLVYERMRVAGLVKEGEIIINMFAGVGCYSIIIANHSKAQKIYSIDINPLAVSFMRDNIRLNRLWKKVDAIEGDAKEIIENRFSKVGDRVLMPLPEKSFEYLSSAISALKKEGGWIHYYGSTHAKKEDPAEKLKLKVIKKMEEMKVPFNIPFHRIVRTTGPNWYQVALDIEIFDPARANQL